MARQKANESSKINENRHMNARRFDSEYMAYCSYHHISGGPKTFETMKLNDYDAMPSIHSIEKYIYKNKLTITEGKLRHLELAPYLKALKLDPYVSLSEDATNVTGTFEYFPKLNQIIGLVPPKCQKYANSIIIESKYTYGKYGQCSNGTAIGFKYTSILPTHLWR